MRVTSLSWPTYSTFPEKLVKYLDGAKLNLKWHCYAKDTDHCADVTVSGPKFAYHASGHTDCLYKTIDLVIDKLEKQLSKHKQKIKSRRAKHKSDLIIVEPDMAWTDYEDDLIKESA